MFWCEFGYGDVWLVWSRDSYGFNVVVRLRVNGQDGSPGCSFGGSVVM